MPKTAGTAPRFKGVSRLPRCKRILFLFPCACTQGFLYSEPDRRCNTHNEQQSRTEKTDSVTALRKQCRENDVHYCVLKNRLVLRALKELNIEGLDALLEGPNAFVFGEKDVTAAPKIISSFIEKNKLTSLEIKGGLMGTEVMDVAAIKELAATPSREELLATMVGCLVSPVSALVSVLEQIAEKKEAA